MPATATVPTTITAPTAAPPGPDASGLPVALTSFVGREQDLQDLGETLDSARLVTLTGPGGVGKSRLAAEVARGRDRAVRWVDMTALRDPALVTQAVSGALAIREEPGRPLPDSLADGLRTDSVLVILDGCEHVLAAVAELAETLLVRCPPVRLLATSRAPLAVQGEVTWPVPLLAVPDRGTPPAALAQVPAVRLLADRVRAVLPAFRVEAADPAAVGALCRRLDGVPLAIELAAPRLRLLSVAQVNDRLDDALGLLVGSDRSPARHRSLQATMDWSAGLLSAPEQELFLRLSVFAGSFGLEAAEQVAAGPAASRSALDLLTALVSKSLVQVVEHRGEMRYRLLQIVRQYAADRLGDPGDLHRRHAGFYLRLAEQAAPQLEGSGQREWLDRLDIEIDNLRAAIDWSTDGNWPEGGLRLAAALGRFCYLRGFYSEGCGWLRQALRAGTEAPLALRGRALLAAGRLAHLQCEYDTAAVDLRQALAACRAVRDAAGEAEALQALGSVARERADYPRARQLHEEALALSRELGSGIGIARSLNYLAFLSWLEGRPEGAVELGESARPLLDRLADHEGTA